LLSDFGRSTGVRTRACYHLWHERLEREFS
jgi:hypothetical protein